MLVKDKWGNLHKVNDRYDNKDIQFVPPVEFKGMIPTDQLSRNAYNMNRSSTRVNEKRAISMNIDGSNVEKKRKNNW